ncbi:MAG: hypothetical protein K2K87_06355, partial [Lachnospiraceae bacterium]|nr:hypothetical protein [Lachnospiraceae bacterium]
IIDWGMSNGATYSTTAFLAKAGDVVTINVWTDPENQKIEAGVERVGGGAVSVTSSDTIAHQFTISEEGHYRVFIKNCSGMRITVSGSFSH